MIYTLGLTVFNIALVSCGWYAVWNLRIKKIPFVIKFFELDAVPVVATKPNIITNTMADTYMESSKTDADKSEEVGNTQSKATSESFADMDENNK